jgi:F-type H+-transporting ATPase subunit epsilon
MVTENHPLHCLVITPEGQVLDAKANAVVLPAHDGMVGVMNKRAAMVCQLGVGVLTVSEPDGRRRLLIDRGFVEVLNNEVTVLTQTALLQEQIDRVRASEELDQALAMKITDEESLQTRAQAIARAKAELSLLE